MRSRRSRSISGRVYRSVSTAALDAVDRLAALGPAEVEPAGQLAHDEQVRIAPHLGSQRRGIGERLMGAHGPQVREQLEARAQAQQRVLRT